MMKVFIQYNGLAIRILIIIILFWSAYGLIQPATVASPIIQNLNSPFGFHPAGVFKPGYQDNGYTDALNIGVKWAREGVYAFWFLVQPDLGSPVYDFTLYDQQWSNIPTSMTILANIAPQGPVDEGRCLPGSWLPIDEAKYIAFVKATVERYDGDSIDDMPGLTTPIKYWQVGNEPNNQERSDFAKLQRITYQAIKQVCPDCTVLIGGVAGFPNGYIANFDVYYAPILTELAGQYVDVFDFHWYGVDNGEYRLQDTVSSEDVLDHIRTTLIANGFPFDLPIWITEMGSYSGDPVGPQFPLQTEKQQASDYLKRFIYPLSRGVKKVFPAFGLIEGFKHDGGYFDHTGLIYDGQGPGDLGLGIKKLAYYTFKKMTEKLEGSNWETLTTLHDGTKSDHLYSFRIEKDEQPIYIAWWDYFDEPGYTPGNTKILTLTSLDGIEVTVTDVVPNYMNGSQITNDDTAFTVTTYPILDGSAIITLSENPVFIEIVKNISNFPDLSGVWSNISKREVGTRYRVSGKLTVNNTGTQKASQAVVKVYISDNATYEPSDQYLGSRTFTINANRSTSKTLNYLITGDPSGKYFISVIDPENTILESNENNNIGVSNAIL